MSLLIENITAQDVEIQDMGLTVPALGTYDISGKPLFDRYSSVDAVTLLTAGTLIIRGQDTLPLSVPDSIQQFKGVVSTIVNGSGVTIYPLVYTDSKVKKNEWVGIGSLTNSDAAHVVPVNGNIVRTTVSYEEVDQGTVYIDLYRDNSKLVDDYIVLAEGGDPGTQVSTPNPVPVVAGDRLRLRGAGTNSSHQADNVVITLYIAGT